MAKSTTTKRGGRVLLARWGRHRCAWDADEVAAHLMGCRAQMVRGLARKSPWAGLEIETLDSCFGLAAAIIAKVAVSGQRPEWRTPRDLEKAQIAAYRYQALDHWKRVNAQSREGDRHAVVFDPERHASDHKPMDRLFDQPDLHTIERDLLAELADDRLRAFWTIVLHEQVPFKTAGDRLGLSKSAVMACTRGGRVAFANYLERRADGDLCRDRSLDITAKLAGTASAWRVERAEAHLESCYLCALIHEPRTSAIQRGILDLAPTGLVLRLLARAGDAASAPAVRIAESGSSSRTVAACVAAALSVVGTSVVVEQRSQNPRSNVQRRSRVAPTAAVGRGFTKAQRAIPVAPSARKKASVGATPRRPTHRARQVRGKVPRPARYRPVPVRRIRSKVSAHPDEFDVEVRPPLTTTPPSTRLPKSCRR